MKNVYDAALNREILKSESSRLHASALILTGFFVLALVARTVRPDSVRALFHRDLEYWRLCALFLPFIAYSLLIQRVARHKLRNGQDVWHPGRYINMLIETSIPSVFLLAQTQSGDVVTAMGFWTGLLYFLFISLSTLRLDFRLSVFTGAVAAIELFAIACYRLPLTWNVDPPTLFVGYHLSRSFVLLAAGVIAGYVGTRLRRQFEVAQQAVEARDRLNNLFGQHVSPAVVERLLVSGNVGETELRDVCIMFLDIRGFTAAAHERSPEEVVTRLDEAFALLVEIVDQHHGIVNKFLGDGFLAIFGAPLVDPTAVPNAVAAGEAMLKAMGQANETSDWPLRLGIGIHVGPVVTGTVGSPRRKEYTVIGDTVNFASRLEALNKDYGSQLLISEAVHRAATGTLERAEPLGPVPVRGYNDPIPVWRLA